MGFIQNFEALAGTPERKIVLALIEAAFASIQPEVVFQRNLQLQGDILSIQDRPFDLSKCDRVFVVGFGKGSAGIARMVEDLLGDKLSAGWDIDVTEQAFSKIEFTLGTHPLPSQTNLDFTKKVTERLADLTERDLVIVITCGGGSAMFEYPNTLDAEGIKAVNQALLHAGATISEMNAIRKHLSRVKGGGLAKLLHPATVANLLFSDVPGNDLSVIASGPTVDDPTTIDDAWKVYETYHLADQLHLPREAFTETPKDEQYFIRVHNFLVVSNHTALEAMQQKATELGWTAEIHSDKFQSEARLAGQKLLDAAQPRSILLAGGETTVKVTGHGEGGRNQEVVLASLPLLQDGWVLSSFDSDGWDNSPVAGAVGDVSTAQQAKEQHLDPQKFLQEDNSLPFFRQVGDTIETGRLPSNVSDLFIVLKGS